MRTAVHSPPAAGPGLLPQALAAVLGLVAASLAYGQVVRRARHQSPAGRHARTGIPPDPDPDPDNHRATSRRP